MTESTKEYGILVAVNGSPGSDAAVSWAAHEAVMHHLPITLMHVMPPVVVSWPTPVLPEFTRRQEADAQLVIEHARKVLQDSVFAEPASIDVRAEVARTAVVPGLVDASRQGRMIVVGSRGRGPMGRMLLGSISSRVVHHAQCPVVVVHHDDAAAPDPRLPVVLGIDGSPASEAATAFAFDEASRRKVELVAVHAWSDVGVAPLLGMDWHRYEDEAHEVLGERLAGWREQYPDVYVRRRIVCDKPAHWLIVESQQAQLVVVGSRGRGGFPGMLLGSVSSTVAQSAESPVIVVRNSP